MSSNTITVLGAGSWGTTLGVLLSDKNKIRLWEFDKNAAEKLNQDRENKNFLPGIKFPESITITNDLSEAIKNSSVIIFAVPSFALRNLCEKANDFILKEQILVSVIKGLEDKTFLRMSQIIDQTVTNKKGVVALSGPTHAEEVSKKIPTAIVSACTNMELAKKIQMLFMREYFRVYTNEDIIGVELGAATKNVIAIIAGICDGIGFGDNTKAALITRGLAEMIRLGKKSGAEEKTFSGLAGIGDLIVTCSSKHSRNRFVGENLGKGLSIDEILKSMTMVAEGVKNCKSIYHFAKSLNVEMPLTEELYKIIYEKSQVKESLKRLLGRKEKHEHWE